MIFYFTATGNSLQAAQFLAGKLQTELISIPEAIAHDHYTYELTEGESVGFVFPVYFYGIPTIIRDFISRLELKGQKEPYLYSVLTCGGTSEGAGRMFKKQLEARGYRLSASFSVKMVDNYILMFKIISKEEQEERLAGAEKALEEIGELVKEKREGDFDRLKRRISGIVTGAAYPFYLHGRKTKKFYAGQNCSGCGLCASVCPCSAIGMEQGRPVWQKKQCIHCLGCIHRCPLAAIQYGKATAKRGRYVNPRAKLSSLSAND
jgi:ferredoxin